VKIVFLTQYYPPEIGAAPNRNAQLAGHFAKAGHDVLVLTAMPNYPGGKIFAGYGGVFRRERLDGIDVIRTYIYPTQSASFLKRLTNYFSFVLSSAVVGAALLPRADYLVVESPPLFLGLSGFVLSRLKRMRMIFNVADLWPETAVRLGVLQPQGLAYAVSSRLEAFCYRHAWLVTGQSRSIVADIERRFPGVPTYLLSNGVETARFSTLESGDPGLRAGSDCVALYAGLHGLAQGLEQVVEVARRLDGRSRCRFVLVGDGPDKAALEELARREAVANVVFLPSRPASDMPALLAAGDMILVPLKVFIPGAVPSKLYEAMASGRPIVLVAHGEAADLVREHRAGIVVAPGDIDGFAEAVLALERDPDLRRELGENGRRAAEGPFNRATIAKDFERRLTSAAC